MSERGLAAIRAAAESSTSATAIAAGLAAAPGAPAARETPAVEPAAAAVAAAPSAESTGEMVSPETAKTGERARINAIVNAPEAKGRESLAQHLAFNTDLAAADAVAMLKAAPAAAERSSRLEGKVPTPHVDAVERNETGDRSAGLSAALTRQLAKIGKKPLTH